MSLVRTTPVVSFPAVSRRVASGAIAFKLENLQRTGSFKLRGAVRRIAAMSSDERARGVVAASAGNHGAAMALAGAHMGVEVTVVAPRGTPAIKCDRMRQYGADVVIDGADYDEAESLARVRASTANAVFVSPFDDEHIIAGNGGDLARELEAQVGDIARVVCSVGGGGLIAGLAAHFGPRGVSVVGVQPEVNCAMYLSLQRGRAVIEYPEGEPTIAEGCAGAACERTFAMLREHAPDASIALVGEDAIRRAVAFCYREAGQVVEASAAVAVAGLLEGAVEPAATGTTVCVITGGNIDPERLDEYVRDGSVTG